MTLDPSVVGTGDRADGAWTGPIIQEVIEGEELPWVPNPRPSETWPSPPFVRTAQEIRDQTQLFVIWDRLFNIAMTSRKANCMADVMKGDRPRDWRQASIHTCPGGTAKEVVDILRTYINQVPDSEYVFKVGTDQRRLN